MATSGTTTWNLNVDEIIQKAMKRVGGDTPSAVDAQEARTNLNLVLTDLINRGAPLSTLELRTQTFTSATNSYTLDSDIVSIMDAVVRRDNTDMSMERLDIFDYNSLANKSTTGRPSQFAVDRGRDALTVYVYPSPENSTDEMRFWAVTRIQDVNKAVQDVDLAFRYTPALISGVAYYASLERDSIPEPKVMRLQQQYEVELNRALEEDRFRSSMYVTPKLNTPRY